MGPPRQSDPLNYEALLELDLKMDALVDKGPVNTKGMAVMNTMFMVRELEAALAMRKHVRTDMELKLVTWELPVSKTDPQALGCKRTWGCSCLQDRHRHEGCVYHVAVEHLAELRKRFGEETDDDDLTLFPQESGQPVSPEVMIAVIELLATMIGEEIHTPDGRKRFGKHSWRSTGAVFLTSLGVEVFKVQLMARWSSPVVTHYTRLAPLKAITDDFRRALTRSRDEEPLHRDIRIKKLRKALDKNIEKVQKEVQQLEDALKALELRMEPKRYVINMDTNRTHRVLTTVDEAGLYASTVCGYKYATRRAKLTNEPPTRKKETCGTCLNELRAVLLD